MQILLGRVGAADAAPAKASSGWKLLENFPTKSQRFQFWQVNFIKQNRRFKILVGRKLETKRYLFDNNVRLWIAAGSLLS